jgi:hypothetical protein
VPRGAFKPILCSEEKSEEGESSDKGARSPKFVPRGAFVPVPNSEQGTKTTSNKSWKVRPRLKSPPEYVESIASLSGLQELQLTYRSAKKKIRQRYSPTRGKESRKSGWMGQTNGKENGEWSLNSQRPAEPYTFRASKQASRHYSSQNLASQEDPARKGELAAKAGGEGQIKDQVLSTPSFNQESGSSALLSLQGEKKNRSLNIKVAAQNQQLRAALETGGHD